MISACRLASISLRSLGLAVATAFLPSTTSLVGSPLASSTPCAFLVGIQVRYYSASSSKILCNTKLCLLPLLPFLYFSVLFFAAVYDYEYRKWYHHCCCTGQYIRYYLWPLPHSLVGIRVQDYYSASSSLCTTQNSAYYICYLCILAGKLYQVAFFFHRVRASEAIHHSHCCCCTVQYVRNFRRATLEKLRALTDSIAGSDHTASTAGSISSFNTVHAASEYTLQYFRLCTFVLPELWVEYFAARYCSCTVGTRSNLGGYCHNIACPEQLMS